MKNAIKAITDTFGIQISKKQFNKHLDGFVSMKPRGQVKGNVLLAYIIDPFLLKPGENIPNTHTHFWESKQIAQTFLDMGFTVDAISYHNTKFKPTKEYSFFISARTNFQKIAELLDEDCIKIVNLDMAHWIPNNFAAYHRCYNVYKRRKVTIRNYKLQEENFAIEHADYATVLGNTFTMDTYKYANKPLFRVPLPTCVTYPWFEDKDYNSNRKNYLWFGSRGFLHKGLDLVLEAFSQMPEYNLTVCGPIEKEKDFEREYYNELYNTQNIHTIGWIDIESQKFQDILKSCVGIVYPSCCEGGGGSVLTCMQGGLIPIVSYETSVDIKDNYGVMLEDSSTDEIKKAVQHVSGLSELKIKEMSYSAWEFARANHTKETFIKNYRDVIEEILTLEKEKKFNEGRMLIS